MSRRTAKLVAFVSVAVAVLAVASATAVPVEARPPFNCKMVSCPPPACEPGEHTAVPPGQCCPVCVPD